MNAIYEITLQQLENVFNEVENQTECWITKNGGYVEVYKFKLQCYSLIHTNLNSTNFFCYRYNNFKA